MKTLMSNIPWRKWQPHALVVLLFSAVALLFYYPVLSGKQLLQSDIKQYEGMARQLKDYREAEEEELYWIDNAFGGMPTYQLGVQFPLDVLTPVYSLVRIFPRPAHLLFLYLICSYVLLIVLKIPWRVALLGAVAFGFSTYLLIILQVGHNTKAEAIAYMPLVLAGWFMIFQGKKAWGWLLSILALGMQIRANHYQMTYYLLLLLAVITVVYAVDAFRNKKGKGFLKRMAVFSSAGILALGLNATPLLATAEYSGYSTRGESPLKRTVEGEPKISASGLDFDYITQYSYGIFESLNIMIPRVQGGGSREAVGTNSDIYKFLIQQGVPRPQAENFVSAVPLYWGSQPILEAPAYVGVSILFLAFIAMFSLRGPKRTALLFGILLSLLISWGKNFSAFTAFMIDYFPLYDKFRAVSSAQVILELCLPVLAASGVHQWIKSKADFPIQKWLRYSAFFIVGLLLLYLSKSMLTFSGPMDSYLQEAYGPTLFDQILQTRKDVFTADILRALGFSILLSLLGYLFLRNKIKAAHFSWALLAIVTFDVLSVAERYVNRDLFVSPRQHKQQWIPNQADALILQDTAEFRVYEPELRLSGGRTAYFHNAIGGYHGAKLGRFQEAFDFFVAQQWSGFLNMLNTKYVIYGDGEKPPQPLINTEALGPVWMIDSVITANDADGVLEALKTADVAREAVLFSSNASQLNPLPLQRDTLARIGLKKVSPQHLIYDFESTTSQLLVFSEIYYPKGWQATLDGSPIEHFPVNYLLRGMQVDKGSHQIEFKFTPSFLNLGTTLRGISSLVVLLVFAGMVRKKLKQT